MMSAAEYDAYLPRLAGNFKVLELLPQFTTLPEWDLIGAVSAFANQELQAGLKRRFEVGEQTARPYQQLGAFIGEMYAAGYPLATGAFCKAPFDRFADFLRSVDATTRRSGCRHVFMPLHWGLNSFMSPKQSEIFYWPEVRKTILGLIEKNLVPCVFWEGNCTSRLETMARSCSKYTA
jgi:hypothetical protein